ncbi:MULTISPECIES: DUF397 domain-containing protein [unclassified Frankia]|uniref:DUF397 domain-containing protein n=1 Tax=unclassified Frankia TaxID=2632575 RepID=UPI001EF43197|nr:MULTISPECIES: DUF397 domain-containing protein [unclassified Frankia]
MDLTNAEWRKSSYSATQTNCVEVARTSEIIAVRDSKDPTGPVLVFTPSEWAAFVAGVSDGEFDI